MLHKMTDCRDDSEKFNCYDIAAAMFDETAKLFADSDTDRTKIPEVRTNLGHITEMLRALDIEGMAERTELLPISNEIQCFDYQRLETLVKELGEIYFPVNEQLFLINPILDDLWGKPYIIKTLVDRAS